jgi:hypothetical protein
MRPTRESRVRRVSQPRMGRRWRVGGSGGASSASALASDVGSSGALCDFFQKGMTKVIGERVETRMKLDVLAV